MIKIVYRNFPFPAVNIRCYSLVTGASNDYNSQQHYDAKYTVFNTLVHTLRFSVLMHYFTENTGCTKCRR
ncbi:hypothetical protein XCR1_1180005 [Xenorhabdus cabanillasii JM26]|uniref:Uncharacterized protein n=1 Tax=Xenorhabdus cabanillasii JM26 TaxID=1427517 RepID=W1IMB3_9GAMM|nr:hypothetical protein XCR1_1180005 [Xenorhabdus cabanillasii JM26]